MPVPPSSVTSRAVVWTLPGRRAADVPSSTVRPVT
jgi:hypothetical protein